MPGHQIRRRALIGVAAGGLAVTAAGPASGLRTRTTAVDPAAGGSEPPAPPFAGDAFDTVPAEEQGITARFESTEPIPSDDRLVTVLDRRAHLDGFGRIAYRRPLRGTDGPRIVMFHGIFGGTSHRDLLQLARALDDEGARVWIMDLPGVALSAKPKRRYSQADLDSFVAAFLVEVVRRPADVVGTGVSATSVLTVAGHRPELVRTATLLSPVGVTTYARPPDPQSSGFHELLLATENISTWLSVVSPQNVRRFIQAVSDPTLFDTDLWVAEILLERANLDQRWIGYAFVTGQLWRPFAEAAAGVTRPVMAVFEGRPVDFDFTPGIPGDDVPPEGLEDFRSVAPRFRYETVAGTSSPQREKPAETAALILDHGRA
jgi:pimeloyl-ACP methyl ester carboxylesterase